MRYYLADGSPHYRPAPYLVQYALERLAQGREGTTYATEPFSAMRSDGGSLRRRQCLSACRASFDSALVAKLGHVLPRILHDLPILQQLCLVIFKVV